MHASWDTSDIADAPLEKEYSVRLWGGETLRVRLAAEDLSAVGELLRRERALVGQLLVEEDGCPAVVGVLVPGGRVQLVVDHVG